MRVALLGFLALLAAHAIPAAAEMSTRDKIALLRGLSVHEAAPPELPARLPGRCAAGDWWRRSPTLLRLRIEQSIDDASLLADVPRALLHSVIRVESNYDTDAVSHAGAQGLMQLMPATARQLGVACAFDPRENVLAGSRYLRRLYERFGSWSRALAAYNAGPERAARDGWPAETRRYVRDVLRHYRSTGGATACAGLEC